MAPAGDVVVRDGLRLYTPAGRSKCPRRFSIAIRLNRKWRWPASAMLLMCCDGCWTAATPSWLGRLAGAFRRIGRPEVADEIVAAMRAANFTVRETDPFAAQQAFGTLRPATAPIVGRMQAMWQTMRGPVMAAFPKAPGLPKDQGDYIKFVDEIYKS